MKYDEGYTEYLNTDSGTFELRYTNEMWEVTYSPERKAKYILVGKFKKRNEALKVTKNYS